MLFIYQAKTPEGKTIIGEQEANDKADLAHALKSRNLFLISAVEKKSGEDNLLQGTRFSFSLALFEGVSVADLMMFVRNLAIMIGAGVALPRALLTLSRQTQNKYFSRALQDIEASINQGKTFSQAISGHPKIFNALFVSMAAVGEASGTLVGVLNLLAEQLKKEHELRSRIIGALIYPAVIVTAMIAIGIMMMIFVVPTISEVFIDMEIEAPAITQFILDAGDFFSNYWWAVFVGIAVAIYGVKRFFSTAFGARLLDWFLLRAPIFGDAIRKIQTARFSRTFASLIAGGVPILEALRITSDTLGNSYYKQSLTAAEEKVQKGDSLHSALAAYSNLYTPLVVQMVEVGEETGQLSDILSQLAGFYEEEVSTLTQNLSSIIEPILMIIIGISVGLFAFSIIQPMYSFMGQI